jgi:cytochrome d oxidase subunit CydB
MDLNTLWFILIAVLYIGFFVLEGFDFGVGILLPFLGKDDRKRRVLINAIGPHWDGNEVWLLTAGGNLRGISKLVRHALQRFLSAPVSYIGCPDRARGGF